MSLHTRIVNDRVLRVQTSHVMPPIPDRSHDWCAVDYDRYDADCDQDGFFSLHPVGHGQTEDAAIADLIEQLEDDS